jgi:hypothetical protein
LDASFDEGRAVCPFGRPGSNAASHPFGEIVVVLPAVQADGLFVLAPLDGMNQFLHISDRSRCDANRARLDFTGITLVEPASGACRGVQKVSAAT